MIENGTIVNVEVETLGSELSAAIGLSDTVLHLRSTVDFSDLGGIVQVGSTTAFSISYSPNAVDDEALTLTLDTAVGIIFPEGTFVYVSPAPIQRYWAHAQIDGDDDDVILAELSRPLAMSLARGARDPADMESSAILEERDGTWTVIDVLGIPLTLVGSAIYVPDIDNPNFSVDGDGDLVARSAVFMSKDNSSIPLIIQDDLDTGKDWTQWKDDGGTIRLWVDTSGNLYAESWIGWKDQRTDSVPAVAFMDGPINPTGAVGWSSGSAGPDVKLWRSDPSELTLSDEAMAAADFRFIDGAGLFVGSDVRLRRSGLITLNVDDGTGAAAVLRITNLLDIDTRAAALTDPPVGRLRLYVTNDGSGHPQLRVRNNVGTPQTLTTFSDGT